MQQCVRFVSSIAKTPLYLLLIVVVAGCRSGIDRTLAEKIEQNYALPPGASLSVTNEDGSIRLYGAKAQEVHVQALKRAYSRVRLDGIRIQASESAATLAINTIFPPKPKWSLRDRSGTVDYVITFPQESTVSKLELVNGEISIDGLRKGRARARVVNGRLSARNCFGDLDYQAWKGAIDFYYDWWEEMSYSVKSFIGNGTVGLRLPRNASFRVQAETQAGSVMTNFKAAEQSGHDGRKKLTMILGAKPGPAYHLETASGNIRIEGYK